MKQIFVHTKKVVGDWDSQYTLKKLHVKPSSPFLTVISQETVGENILSSIPLIQLTPILPSHQFSNPVSINTYLQIEAHRRKVHTRIPIDIKEAK